MELANRSLFRPPPPSMRLIIILLSVVIYLPSLTNFFSSDDWFHLRVSRIETASQFVNFFSFVRNFESITSYRPIPSQVFFFVFQSLFGLNPLPYHLFALVIFALNITLVYYLAKEIFLGQKLALLSGLLYGVSVVHFTALYSIASFQEIALVFFVLCTLLAYRRAEVKKSNPWRVVSLFCFVLALMSKETAAVVPVLLIAFDRFKDKIKISRVIPFVAVLVPYLFLRFFVFGGVAGDAYQWDFSPKRVINTAFWYTLWSFGAPELLVDYVGSGLRPIPRFFVDFPRVSWLVLGGTVATVFVFVVAAVKSGFKRAKIIAFGLIFFWVSLLPVLFLPWHKFTLELGLPMVGFSLTLASIIGAKSKVNYLFIVSFIILNLLMNLLTYKNHYSVNRASLAEKVYDYFISNYPAPPKGEYFEFINDSSDFGPLWGSSKQIAQATSRSEMFKVLYKDPKMEVYFQDFPGERPVGEERVEISSKMFLGVD